MNYKRVTLLSGHYGSGKTGIAVAMAMEQKKRYERVAIADLDIVNPYFRTKDSQEELEAAGIRLICSKYANSNVDLPALPDEMYSIIDETDQHVIIDVGGDDRGALALGRIAPALLAEDDYDMYMVINMYRPLTRTPEDTYAILREIEYACGMPFTGLINNSNLGHLTQAEDVLSSAGYAAGVAQLTGLPLAATTVRGELYGELEGRIEELYPVSIRRKIFEYYKEGSNQWQS